MITKIEIVPATKAGNTLFFNTIDLTKLPDYRIVPLFGANGAGKSTLIDAIRSDYNFSAFEKHALAQIEKARQEKDGSKPFMLAVSGPNGEKEYPIVNSEYDEAGWWEEEIKAKEKDRQAVCTYDTPDGVSTNFYFYRNDEFNLKSDSFLNDRRQMYDPIRISEFYNARSLSEGQSLMYSIRDFLLSLEKDDSLHKENSQQIVLLDEIDSGLSVDNVMYVGEKIIRILKKHDDTQIIMAFNSPVFLKYFPYVISMYDGKVHELHSFDNMLSELKNNKKMLDKARKKSNGDYKIFA